MRGDRFPGRAAQGLSLLLYSPAQDGKHITCFPLRAELATNLNSGRPVWESDVLVGATLPAKKGQVYFVRFYLGKRRTPAVVPFFLQHVDHQRFRKCGEKSQTSQQTDIIDNKTAVQ